MATKLCINCKHYQPAEYPEADKRAEFARCGAQPSLNEQRLARVDGRNVRGMYCEVARSCGGCGHDALLFEERAA